MARAHPPPHLSGMLDTDPPLPGSLAALEGLDIPKGAYGGPRVARLSRALRVPLDALSLGEVRFLLSEGRALDRMIPLALDRLGDDPLRAADGTPGDLLVTLLAAAEPSWNAAPPWRAAVAQMLSAALTRLRTAPASLQIALGDELAVARDRFLSA